MIPIMPPLDIPDEFPESDVYMHPVPHTTNGDLHKAEFVVDTVGFEVVEAVKHAKKVNLELKDKMKNQPSSKSQQTRDWAMQRVPQRFSVGKQVGEEEVEEVEEEERVEEELELEVVIEEVEESLKVESEVGRTEEVDAVVDNPVEGSIGEEL
ncbi:hypothetical protein HK096_002848 [Nowakowskiella sp. JEL0078]|nr:hypothetical protein HK096_002848 [Nowakowskiella sp. JEL0078]